MTKFNLSIVILAYNEYENIFNFITHLNKQELKFNNIIIVSDKIDVRTATNITDTVNIYRYKNLVMAFDNIIHINKSVHGGVIGTVDYKDEIKSLAQLNENENIVVLEDDLFTTEEFFKQCEIFFSDIYSDSSPIFVGYSKTNNTENKFFETFNLLYMWGFAMKVKDFNAVINYHNQVRKYDTTKKQEIINDVLNFEYPCEIFEKYKSKLMETIKFSFIRDSKESVDLYFMFYYLQHRIKIIKHSKSYIKSFKPNDCGKSISSDIEMDMVYNLESFTI